MVLVLITNSSVIIVSILLAVAFFSLFERKMMGLIQLRKGPNKVSMLGLLQPLSDAMKLIAKTDVTPISSSPLIYSITPLVFMIFSLCYWIPIPVKGNWFFMQSGVLFIVFCMSTSVYMIIILGWFSNSKYSMIGSIRSIIQTVSYEIVLSFILFCMCVMSLSISLVDILKYQMITWFIYPLMPLVMPMIVSMLAETNRTPFDLTEGESELVSGFCVEYGALSYTFIFLSENASILFMTVLLSLLFTNYTYMVIMMLIILIVWLRATLPRMRFDKMMLMCWVLMLPIVLMSLMMITLIM